MSRSPTSPFAFYRTFAAVTIAGAVLVAQASPEAEAPVSNPAFPNARAAPHVAPPQADPAADDLSYNGRWHTPRYAAEFSDIPAAQTGVLETEEAASARGRAPRMVASAEDVRWMIAQSRARADGR